MRRLRQLLAADRPAPVIVLEGPAGSGKSALAARVAHDIAAHYPDGQFYLDLDHEVTEQVLAMATSALAERRVLAVLDNASSAGLIERMCPPSGRGAALVTSAAPLGLRRSVRSVYVGPLSVEQSVALLEDIVDPERLRAEPEAVRQLLELCDRLPLALHIVALRLASRPAWSIEALTVMLADERRCLDELNSAGLDMRASLAASYEALVALPDVRARHAVGALHVLTRSTSSDVDVRAAEALLGPDAERMMESLVDSRLVEGPAPGLYRVPRLVRLFVAEKTGEMVRRC
ncbi:hypothetical protein GCM10017774_86990 [Lentzea cavernae]|uniref:AAA+ ATPase domain-containing protein n=2 Tax=Lentzea cavernae TaxID=2020703 RepID=A0ABQ3N3R7_9PSEU|nr:hypothetical protein GCM10017774_86990 [Lentzea cavernae]